MVPCPVSVIFTEPFETVFSDTVKVSEASYRLSSRMGTVIDRVVPGSEAERIGLQGIDYRNRILGDVIVAVDPHYFRPSEVETLLGDPAKAKAKLGWIPEISLEEMVSEMVAYDLDIAKRHALLKRHGHEVAISLGQ